MEYFSLSELTHTNTGIENTPTPSVKENLERLVDCVLDPCRRMYGNPISVNSGYRSLEVNKKVGGAATSQHLKGEAADITGGSCSENKKLFEILKSRGVFDQLIDEYDYKWVHVSFKKGKNRQQVIHKR